MKTKLLFTLLLSFLFSHSIFSQDYIPMLNSSWNIVEANFGGSTNYIIEPGIDVVIGETSYKKFLDKTTDVYLREDVVTRKVYKRVNNMDIMMYDFNLQNGDFITLENGYDYSVTVSTVNVVGGTRKKITLYNDFLPNENWIEGVGSTHNPMKRTYELPSDPYVYMTCSSINNVNVYNHGLANGSTNATDCSMLLGIEDFPNSQKITFYPNPFKSMLTILTDDTLTNARFIIFNSLGQLVKENRNLNGQKFIFSRDHLKSGIYFGQLSEGEKLIATTKILIVD